MIPHCRGARVRHIITKCFFLFWFFYEWCWLPWNVEQTTDKQTNIRRWREWARIYHIYQLIVSLGPILLLNAPNYRECHRCTILLLLMRHLTIYVSPYIISHHHLSFWSSHFSHSVTATLRHFRTHVYTYSSPVTCINSWRSPYYNISIHSNAPDNKRLNE